MAPPALCTRGCPNPTCTSIAPHTHGMPRMSSQRYRESRGPHSPPPGSICRRGGRESNWVARTHTALRRAGIALAAVVGQSRRVQEVVMIVEQSVHSASPRYILCKITIRLSWLPCQLQPVVAWSRGTFVWQPQAGATCTVHLVPSSPTRSNAQGCQTSSKQPCCRQTAEHLQCCTSR